MSESVLKLLLVDDEDSVREPLARHLRANPYNYVVTDVADANEALRALTETNGSFDVALVDEVLEESINGLELLQQIKILYPQIECILFTGWGMQSGVEALRAGAYRYFSKPFNLEELALTIRFAGEQKRIRKERDYMEALVKVSQALTQTTDLDEQLQLVWDFLREQLVTPTCFVALCDPHTNSIHFPLSYDEGESDPLPDLDLNTEQNNQGLAIYVVETGQELVWPTREQKENDWRSLGIQSRVSLKGPSESGICLPLRAAGKILGAFSVQSYKAHAFDQALLNAVRALANQIAISIDNSRLVGETEQKAHKLETLGSLTIAINSTLELDQVLAQTCQAAVELLGVDHSGFVVFEPDYATGKVVAEYPQNEKTFGRIIPVRGIPAEEQLVFQQKVLHIPNVASEISLGPVRGLLHDSGIHSIVIVPVVFNNQVIASFSLDSMRETRAFSQNEIEICQGLANQVAAAIRNAQLYSETNEGREYLQSLYKATTEIISPRDPAQVLQSIVDNACNATGAWRAVALLVDESDRPRILAQSGFDFQMDSATSIREKGVSREVLKSGTPKFIPDAEAESDRVHPAMLTQGVKAAVCLPLPLRGKNIGVLWIHFREKHNFSKTEQQALQLYTNQSAIVFDNSKRMYELGQLQKAAEAMAREEEWKAVLQQIAHIAKEVLDADYTLIWPYDAERKLFFPEDLVAENVPDELLEKFRNIEPETGRTTDHVLKHGFVRVEDLSAEQPDFLGKSTRGFLEELGVKSFIGIHLRVADEPLGVLYIDYRHVRGFGKEDSITLEHFANQAALTLKKARLNDQLRRAHDAVRAVAQVSTVEDLDKTLSATVENVRSVLRCDIATLYTFDEEKQHFLQAKVAGANEESMRPVSDIAPDSALWKVISLKEKNYHLSEDPFNDELLRGHFVRTQGIRTALGIKLLTSGERHVGVMFVNYCTPHRFKDDEIKDALQFADQAAVAIRNAELHNQALKHAEALESLYEAGQTITKTLSLNDTLTRIAEQALHIVGAHCKQAGCFSHIALRDGNKLNFVAAQPNEMLFLLQNTVDIDLVLSTKKGIAGRVALTGETRNIKDVHQDPDYILASDKTKSQLSVPLKLDDDVIGALSIEHPELNAFTLDDKNNIELLAAQAAIAIGNARHLNQIEAMRSAAETIVGATNVQAVLRQIAISARKVMNSDSTSVWPYDELRDTFVHDEFVYQGMSAEVGETFRQRVPRHSGIAYTVLENNLVEIEDAEVTSYPFLRKETRDLLLTNKIRSFVGVPLVAGTEKLGVLYINFDAPRKFSEDDRKTVKTFANQAALALKNVRFLERQNRVRKAFHVIAELTTLGDLNKTLAKIADGAVEVFGCDTVTLYQYDPDRKEFVFPPTLKGALFREKVFEIGRVLDDSVVSKILERDDLYSSEDAQNDSILGGAFVKREGIKSSLGIPLSASGHKVGVMFVSFRSSYHFTEEVLTDIRLFADQAAIAIRNTQLHDKTRQRAEALQGLYDASKAITSTMSLNDTLSRIAEQALRIIRLGYQLEACFSYIALIDENKLHYVAAYPEYVHALLHGDTETDLIGNTKIGITGRTAKTKEPQNIPDVVQNPDYIQISDKTHSQLAVPLKIGDQVIGVLSIEHSYPNAFDSEDVRNVELLAAQAAIAIENTRRYEELINTRDVLAARTALAWTGMVSSTWRHTIEKHALTIREQVELLRGDLPRLPKNDSMEKRLEMMERLANQILRKPISAPLSAEETVSSVVVNDFIKERVHQLWAHQPYKDVRVEIQLELDNLTTVRASIEWLRRAIDILIDNAVDATSMLNERKILIASRKADRRAEILIRDNGGGIPLKIKERLFREQIEKPKDAKGLGMGLLFAQMIVQTYGGEIRVEETGKTGTTMVISLPLEN